MRVSRGSGTGRSYECAPPKHRELRGRTNARLPSIGNYAIVRMRLSGRFGVSIRGWRCRCPLEQAVPVPDSGDGSRQRRQQLIHDADDRHLDLEPGTRLPTLGCERLVDRHRLIAGDDVAGGGPRLALEAGDRLVRVDLEHLLQAGAGIEVELIELAVDPGRVLQQAVALDVTGLGYRGIGSQVRCHFQLDERANPLDRYTLGQIRS